MGDNSICSSATFPFTFFDANGNNVSGVLDDTGSCVFPTASCNVTNSVNDCCVAKEAFLKTGSNYMYIAFPIIFVPILYRKFLSLTPEQREKAAERERQRIPFWVRDYAPPLIGEKLFKYGFKGYIVAQVVIPIFMLKSIQTEMTVSERNAMMAAQAFLVPYSAIFQFVEDIVLVRVNYAMGAGNRPLANELVHLGMIGAFIVGVGAAILGTILGVIPSVLEAITTPGLANDIKLYPGCDFITDQTDVRAYWMFETWKIPGLQLGMVISGYMLGAIELDTLGWLGGVSLAAIPLIWFLAVGNFGNKLLLLGMAEYISAIAFPILAIVYLISPLACEVRERTGVKIELQQLVASLSAWRKGKEEDSPPAQEEAADRMEGVDTPPAEENPGVETDGKEGNENDPVTTDYQNSDPLNPEPESTTKLLVDGLQIMFMDVIIQFCLSLGVYLALVNDAADGYQLTALQAALPTYGIAYALGMGIMFKVVGPQLMARGDYKTFVTLTYITVTCSFLLVPLIVGSVLPFRVELAFVYGGNACSYAKNEHCVPFFNYVFGRNAEGSKYSLQKTFDVFPIGASIEAVFFVLRACLLALVDLRFMLWSTIAAVIIFIPAIVVASLVPPFGGSASAYFVAMYIPQVVLIVLFGGRLFVLLRRISRMGPDAPESSNSGSMRRSLQYVQNSY